MKSILFIIALLYSSIAQSASVEEVIRKVAIEEEVPAPLLSAICWVESKHNVEAYNYNDGGAGNAAFGVCQVLYNTAKDLGFPVNPGCVLDFRIEVKNWPKFQIPIPRESTLCPLFSVENSARYAAKYLKLKLNFYEDFESATSAYNLGIKKTCTTGWIHDKLGKRIKPCIIGDILNRYYVKRVFEALSEGK